MDTSVVKSAQIAIHTFTYIQSDSENDSEDDEEVDSMCFNIHAACKYYANIHTYIAYKSVTSQDKIMCTVHVSRITYAANRKKCNDLNQYHYASRHAVNSPQKVHYCRIPQREH